MAIVLGSTTEISIKALTRAVPQKWDGLQLDQTPAQQVRVAHQSPRDVMDCQPLAVPASPLPQLASLWCKS